MSTVYSLINDGIHGYMELKRIHQRGPGGKGNWKRGEGVGGEEREKESTTVNCKEKLYIE